MKKVLLFFLIFSSVSYALAQQTEIINYQAIVRDGSGLIVKEKNISIRISIRERSKTGDIIYQENQMVTTNENGFFYTHIGTGETTDNFSAIDWGTNIHFLQTEYDFNDGNGYSINGISQMTSVPYANYANNYNENDPVFANSVAGGITQADTMNWNKTNDPFIETDPIFNTSIAKGITETDTAFWNSNISYWSSSTNGINYSNGNVGIGTTTPENLLDIEFTSSQQSDRTPLELRNNSIDIFSAVNFKLSAGNSGSFLQIGHASDTYLNNYFADFGTIASIGKGLILDASGIGEMRFYVGNDASNVDIPLERMRILNNGDIGIGTIAPSEKLSVDGVIESVSGGIKFPDGTIQTTAFTNPESISSITLKNKNSTRVRVFRLGNNDDSLNYQFESNRWYYMAYTKNGLEGKIYIDGELVYNSTFADVGYSHSQVHIGASFFTSFTSYLKGYFDEFRISNVVKTDEEIKTSYTLNTAFNSDANTIALWHFDEGSGISFINEKGGNGTLFGDPTWDVGRFGSSILLDGLDDRGQTNFNPPEDEITYEFWIKFPNVIDKVMCMIQSYGLFNSVFNVAPSSSSESSLILQSPDGACWQMTVDNAGQLQTTSVDCPN